MPELIVLACDKCGETDDVARYMITSNDSVVVLLDPRCAAKVTIVEAQRLGSAPPAVPRRFQSGVLSDEGLRSLHRPRTPL